MDVRADDPKGLVQIRVAVGVLLDICIYGMLERARFRKKKRRKLKWESTACPRKIVRLGALWLTPTSRKHTTCETVDICSAVLA